MAALLSVALALAARAPAAQPRPPETVRLAVTRDARSARCPDAPAVRALLRDRLRRDAVRDDAATSASLRFTRERARYAATLRLRRPGLGPTVRQLRADGDDCARLADAAALVLALAIDPIAALHPAAPPAPAVVQSPPPVVQSPPADVQGAAADVQGTPADVQSPPADVQSPPAEVHTPAADVHTPPAAVQRPPSLQLAALATLSAGVAPGLLGAFRPGLALRVTPLVGTLALPIELAVDAPGSLDDAARRARVDTLPIQLGAGVCGRFGRRVVVPLCALAAVTAIVAWGDGYAPDRADVGFALGLGARAGVEVPLAGRWWFVASAELRALALRPALQVNGTAGGTLWTSPLVAATMAFGVAWSNR